jgi:L-asparaginase
VTGQVLRASTRVLALLLLALTFFSGPFATSPAAAQTAPAGPAAGAADVRDTGAPAPRVHLVATGGTISEHSQGRLTHSDLVASVPGLADHARATSEQFANVASGALTLDEWLRLSRRLNDLLATDAGLAGVVVTSGTDTLEELAYFLHLTVRDPRPVVLVGAMRPPDALASDGPANLLAGFRVAADADARGRGVLVVLDGAVHGARGVTKTAVRRLDAFRSPDGGPLGTVGVDGITWTRRDSHRHTDASEFDVRALDVLPRVDVMLTYQGAPGDLVAAAVQLGARGLVVAALGAGATSGTQAGALDYAVRRGVVVVRGTRTGAGTVDHPPGAGADTVAAGDLSPVKARVLLMLALTRTSDPTEVQAIFDQY